MNQPIIQPGQINIECEHRQDPSGRDPVQPDKVVMGRTAVTMGGLSCREEIASRILAAAIAKHGMPSDELMGGIDPRIDQVLELTDRLLAKTRKKAETE